MINAKFRICLPEDLWVRELSEAFPDATFELLSGYRLDGTAIELGEVFSDEPGACMEAIREHPAIGTFELLESTQRRALSKYETTDTALYEFVERSELPIEFPVAARNGWFEFDLSGTRQELERLRTRLDRDGATYELQSLVTTTDTATLLTERQRELLEAAVREGYFEVPRTCTLAELAASMDIDKATASTILRRGEATVVKWFLTGPDSKGRRTA